MKSDQFFVSNEMDVRTLPAKKRKQYAGVYQADWGRMFEGMIAPLKVEEHYAWCVPCSRDIKVSVSGVYDVREFKAPCSDSRFQSPTETHDHVFQTGGNRHTRLRDHGRGYVFLFRSRTQPPCCLADHLTDLAPRLFLDSEVAKTFFVKERKPRR